MTRFRRRPPPLRAGVDRRPQQPPVDPRLALSTPLLEGIPAPYEVLYGVNPVLEAMRAGRRKLRKLFLSRREESPETRELLALAKEKSLEPVRVERESLDAVVAVSASTEAVDQGVALVVTPYRYFSLEEIAGVKGEQRRRLLALDEIEDPRNLGALARTAEAAGFQGMVVQAHRAAEVTPVAVKASAGATEHLRIARETNLADALLALKEAGYWVVGLDAAPGTPSIFEADLDMDLVLVVGAEGKGLRPRVRSVCDLAVRLPMTGKVSSLNVSAAAAAALWQVLAQESRVRP